MPELPEVETVKNTLKNIVVGKKIKNTIIRWDNIIEYPSVIEFQKQIENQVIHDVSRRGKWLLFELDDYYLLSHLRMEGKYIIRTIEEEYDKHEHVIINFEDGMSMRYKDTRKFGKMHLIKKEELYKRKPLRDIGLEPWDELLTPIYLKNKYKTKSLPIKSTILDQSIIVGIGNIYADEILFLSKVNPLKESNQLKDKDLQNIILNTKKILELAISLGGTTIKSFESSEGVHGRFQQQLLIHGKTGECSICKTKIVKIKVGGRGTYYCPKCQK